MSNFFLFVAYLVASTEDLQCLHRFQLSLSSPNPVCHSVYLSRLCNLFVDRFLFGSQIRTRLLILPPRATAHIPAHSNVFNFGESPKSGLSYRSAFLLHSNSSTVEISYRIFSLEFPCWILLAYSRHFIPRSMF